LEKRSSIFTAFWGEQQAVAALVAAACIFWRRAADSLEAGHADESWDSRMRDLLSVRLKAARRGSAIFWAAFGVGTDLFGIFY
jgi:hypothetical protein